MAKYKTGTGDKSKCLYKLNKEGKRGTQVGCSRNEVKKYLKGLYEYDTKAAKEELKEMMEALDLGKKREALMSELSEIHNSVRTMYETMDYKTYEDSLSEISKMQSEMTRLYKDIAALEK